jgi:hypothetical protein
MSQSLHEMIVPSLLQTPVKADHQHHRTNNAATKDTDNNVNNTKANPMTTSLSQISRPPIVPSKVCVSKTTKNQKKNPNISVR